MAEQATELLPCPFCGNKRIVKFTTAEGELVGCDNCENDMVRLNMGDAIEAWNTRTESQTIAAQQEGIDALQTALSRLCSKYGRTFDETDETRADEALELARKVHNEQV